MYWRGDIMSVDQTNYGILSCQGRYTKFEFNNMHVVFRHGKDLLKYLSVKEWDNGYLVVECLGRVKGEYEDYIDFTYILENLYMEPEKYLSNIQGVRIKNA
jgi:hypothetical protein